MQQEEVKELLKRYSAGTATTEEKAFVEAWYEQYDTGEQIVNEAHLQSLEDEVFKRLPVIHRQPVRRLLPRLVAAASVAALLLFGGYMFFQLRSTTAKLTQAPLGDIRPGGNNAILTLSNGQQISLTNAQNGKLATQANITVKKVADGKLVYAEDRNGASNKSDVVEYNTMTTPRGGHYEATLSDGTHFAMDAASSIRYPVKFTGQERLVEVTGQVYFEVKHNHAQPFKVKVKDQVIEDIGTVFNVNGYDDEPYLITTLLEGSIKVTDKGKSFILKPNQQTTVSANSIKVNDADAGEVIAWKNGDFDFNGETLESIMRKLSRWYNIEVVYADEQIRSKTFTGKISRSKNISQVLKMLEITKAIHFKIEDRSVIVTM